MRLLEDSREVEQKYWFISCISSHAKHFVDMQIKKTNKKALQTAVFIKRAV